MTKKPPMTDLERAIKSRETGIRHMKESQREIRQRADEKIAAIQKRIDRSQVILDAIKRGTLQP
jgi:hypothetical protein